jgi:hypothetical protein
VVPVVELLHCLRRAAEATRGSWLLAAPLGRAAEEARGSGFLPLRSARGRGGTGLWFLGAPIGERQRRRGAALLVSWSSGEGRAKGGEEVVATVTARDSRRQGGRNLKELSPFADRWGRSPRVRWQVGLRAHMLDDVMCSLRRKQR